MPDLTRRRDPARADCWFVDDGDVRVGTIASCAGPNADAMAMACGFYPGRGEQYSGWSTPSKKPAPPLRILATVLAALY